ncbi:hypothetical protein KDL44_08310 [bacterium]|nr:hypothetical protein [bacterium]
MPEQQRSRQQHEQAARLTGADILSLPVNGKLQRQIAGLLRQARRNYDRHSASELIISSFIVMLLTGLPGMLYWPMFLMMPPMLWLIHASWKQGNRDGAERQSMKFHAFHNLLDKGLLIDLIDSRDPRELVAGPALARLLTGSGAGQATFTDMQRRISFLVDNYEAICLRRDWPVSGPAWQAGRSWLRKLEAARTGDKHAMRLRISLLESLAEIFDAQDELGNSGEPDA